MRGELAKIEVTLYVEAPTLKMAERLIDIILDKEDFVRVYDFGESKFVPDDGPS